MLCRTYCASCIGIEAITVTIEVDVSQGISFFLVGLPDSAVRESQQRISTALSTIGARIPGKKIVINMAPADFKKEGSSYDLAIAVGILAASGQYYFPRLSSFIIMGELALDGSLRAVPGCLPVAIHAKKEAFEGCIFPVESAYEAAETEGIDIYAAHSIAEVVAILQGNERFDPVKPADYCSMPLNAAITDFSEIKGQEHVKRGLEIAASGGHNILISGPPGTGKSMMARALAGILPPMTKEESIETTMIYSVAGVSRAEPGLIRERPFRAPHHTCSMVSMAGGGPRALPGEISLAHNGVLYLDEIPEYSRSVLELLRQPMEQRLISISRARYKVEYPCSFMLVASMNPCPCGYLGTAGDRCSCAPHTVLKYRSRLSGPLLDRIDLHIEAGAVPPSLLVSDAKSESTADISARVRESKLFMRERMASFNREKYLSLGESQKRLLADVVKKFHLSARAYTRILKVSRTIADMDKCNYISLSHICEAVQYRSFESKEIYE